MPRLILPAVLLASVPLWGAWPKASDGVARWRELLPKGSDVVVEPRITVSEPRPVAATEDVLNKYMNASLTPGLVATIRVTPGGIELQKAQMMLVPKRPRTDDTQGDRVIIRSLGDGSVISEVAVADAAVTSTEGEVRARQEDRTLSVALPMPALVDTLEVSVVAGVDAPVRESKTFDVSRLVDDYCARAQASAACRRPVLDRGPR
jgi:hypothetical protein